MTIDTRLMTAEELLRLPAKGSRQELIKGELREMPPAGHEHGRITMVVSTPLYLHVSQNRLGKVYAAETGFLIARDPDTVRAPDCAFVSQSRVDQVSRQEGYFPGPPDLAVEVISPGDTFEEVEDKVESWLEAGCRMVVVANPRNRTLKVYRSPKDLTVLTVDDTFDAGDVVPGFQLPVREIFHD